MWSAMELENTNRILIEPITSIKTAIMADHNISKENFLQEASAHFLLFGK